MIFNKKRKSPDMVDVRDLQKRGIVRIPNKNSSIPRTSQGFVEIGSSGRIAKREGENPQSNAEFFNFSPPRLKAEESREQFSSSPDRYDKREVDEKITELDNKIYKLEQRIELLEKKLDVNQSNNTSVIGW